jgi:hypothetical protein
LQYLRPAGSRGWRGLRRPLPRLVTAEVRLPKRCGGDKPLAALPNYGASRCLETRHRRNSDVAAASQKAEVAKPGSPSILRRRDMSACRRIASASEMCDLLARSISVPSKSSNRSVSLKISEKETVTNAFLGLLPVSFSQTPAEKAAARAGVEYRFDNRAGLVR